MSALSQINQVVDLLIDMDSMPGETSKLQLAVKVALGNPEIYGEVRATLEKLDNGQISYGQAAADICEFL